MLKCIKGFAAIKENNSTGRDGILDKYSKNSHLRHTLIKVEFTACINNQLKVTRKRKLRYKIEHIVVDIINDMIMFYKYQIHINDIF